MSRENGRKVRRLEARVARLRRELADGGKRPGWPRFLSGVTLGLLAGGGVGLAFAPGQGKESRARLLRVGGGLLGGEPVRALQAAGLAAGDGGSRTVVALTTPEDRAAASALGSDEHVSVVPIPAASLPASLEDVPAPSGEAAPDGQHCPPTHPIKGNKNSRGEWLYHTTGSSRYAQTVPEACFAGETDAEAAGYRRARG